MLVTGRRPLETGHVINNVRARHDEISIADAFGHAGYRTGWVGKWHLYSGEQPEIVDFEYISDGRDRLGFDYFRAYNYHTQYFDGPLCLAGGGRERWAPSCSGCSGTAWSTTRLWCSVPIMVR